MFLCFSKQLLDIAVFVWYESQFDYVTTTQETETKSVDVGTEGDNANAEYNDVGGNQYNDNAIHNQGGDD